jgi:hypothetical protein
MLIEAGRIYFYLGSLNLHAPISNLFRAFIDQAKIEMGLRKVL